MCGQEGVGGRKWWKVAVLTMVILSKPSAVRMTGSLNVTSEAIFGGRGQVEVEFGSLRFGIRGK